VAAWPASGPQHDPESLELELELELVVLELRVVVHVETPNFWSRRAVSARSTRKAARPSPP
jgi:hypothetical protein